jgi:hypothetical protein
MDTFNFLHQKIEFQISGSWQGRCSDAKKALYNMSLMILHVDSVDIYIEISSHSTSDKKNPSLAI